MRIHLPTFRPFLAGLGAALLAPVGFAANLSGSMSDSTTGPIPPGAHLVVGTITVPTGETLTIQDGAILKFGNAMSLTVQGTLLANGTVGTGIIFTDNRDDTAGGDTNSDGNASSPAPGRYRGVIIEDNSVVQFAHCEFRYSGWGGWAGLYVSGSGSQATVTNCAFSNGSNSGIDINNNTADLTVSGCSFTSHDGYAVKDARIEQVPGFSNNTASGNDWNYMRLSQADPTADITIEETNCLEGALVFGTTLGIPVGVTLRLKAGVVLKMNAGQSVGVTGTLITEGTAVDPVVITAYEDDDHAGDTNNDGPSNGAKGKYKGITVNANGVVNLDHTIVRYSGWGGWSSLYLAGIDTDVTATDCAFRDGSRHGLDANVNVATLSITDCAFEGNTELAMEDVRIEHCEGFSGNTATGNGNNFLSLGQPDPSADVTLDADNGLNGTFVLETSCNIPAGVTLTLNENVVFKLGAGMSISVAGALVTAGTSADPVVITAFEDDDFGGDTNGDGPSNGAPGKFRGIILNAASSGNDLTGVIVRYSGWGGWSGLYIAGSGTDCTIDKSIFADGSHHGIDYNGLESSISVTGTLFTGNSEFAVNDMRIKDCETYLDNAAFGNGGDYLRITSPNPVGQVSIDARNCMNGALVVSTSITVSFGNSLTLLPGAAIKFTTGSDLRVTDGILNIEGEGGNPVRLTSFLDDEVAGDTNGDGAATTPVPGTWRGVRVDAAAGACSIRHLVCRYTGWGGYNGLRSNSPVLDVRATRVEHDSGDSFQITDLAYGSDLVAWNGGQDGISLLGGAFVLERCTAANNGAFGFIKSAGFTGVVNSSNSFGNGSGGYSGFSSGDLTYSNGSPALAGSNGNIDLDPLFVDAVNGDLRLQAASPCIEVGDPLDFPGAQLDPGGIARASDADFDKSPRIDMGAYEFCHIHLEVTGTYTPGGSITVDSTGTPGLLSFLFLGLGKDENLLFPYGVFLVDPLLPYFMIQWAPPPTSFNLPIPLGLPTPLPIAMQQAVLNGSLTAGGNLSELAFFTIKD